MENLMSQQHTSPWPYPRLVAHRGGGVMAPENTLAGFRAGVGYGYRAAECDVKLSADNVCFLLHDDTVDRTTNGQGLAAGLSMAQLAAGCRWLEGCAVCWRGAAQLCQCGGLLPGAGYVAECGNQTLSGA
jgi:glycerophosphoryl diester phosphodiesterase